jgi:hypothetical protein
MLHLRLPGSSATTSRVACLRTTRPKLEVEQSHGYTNGIDRDGIYDLEATRGKRTLTNRTEVFALTAIGQ